MKISVLLVTKKITATVRTVLLPSFKIEGHAKFHLQVGKSDKFFPVQVY